MTLRHEVELETIVLAALGAFVGMFFVWHSNQNMFNQLRVTVPIIQDVPFVSPTPAAQKTMVTSQVSSDGTKKVILESMENSNGSRTYTFTTSDATGGSQQLLYITTLSSTQSASIPFNTFSPDDKYLFIQKGTDALVFATNGSSFPNGQPYIDATQVFNNQKNGNTFGVATGWASETLLIINSVTSDNKKGPSYWLEIPDLAVIPLSTQF